MSRGLEKKMRTISILLEKTGIVPSAVSSGGGNNVTYTKLSGDGSSRIFYRVAKRDQPLCLAVFPASLEKLDMAEFYSALLIAKHLFKAGIPVPEILASDETSGLILFEDLGDLRLHEKICRERQKSIEYLQESVRVLARMQVLGAVRFKPEYCFDAPSYDKKTMLERESRYFLDIFWRQTLFEDDVIGLTEEFGRLADKVMEYFQPLFFHRDFQSRNIMICNEKIRVIDFQAGRLGPPGYDIASLLIDPYIGLSDTTQAHLFQFYIDEISTFPDIKTDQIILSYPYLAVQRNLQIIGAFAFLSGRKGKKFFKPYILPSLIMLRNRLTDKQFEDYPILRETISLAILKYRKYIQG